MSQFFFGILHFLPVVFVLPQAEERKPQADNGNSRHRQAGNKQRERVAGLRQHSGRITIESQEGSSSKATNGKKEQQNCQNLPELLSAFSHGTRINLIEAIRLLSAGFHGTAV